MVYTNGATSSLYNVARNLRSIQLLFLLLDCLKDRFRLRPSRLRSKHSINSRIKEKLMTLLCFSASAIG